MYISHSIVNCCFERCRRTCTHIDIDTHTHTRTRDAHVHTKSLEIYAFIEQLGVFKCERVYTCLYRFYVLYGRWPWTLHYVCLSWLHVEAENPLYITFLQFSFSFVLCRVWVCVCVDFPPVRAPPQYTVACTHIHPSIHRVLYGKRETWEKWKA